ncbi:hypothetical protein [Mesorhizobium sp. M1252]|uniref:hypothetical protein n=1 Tax=Mesorhizobium sp. M1252 TaxID=2957073 RepID=UPI003337FB7B
MSTVRKLAAIRRQLAQITALVAEIETEFEDRSSGDLVETAVAAEALGQKIDTIRNLCRRKGFGQRAGGRWKADVAALREYFRQT